MSAMEEGEVKGAEESTERYIARLEATLRKYARLNRELAADLATVRAQCKLHYDNCQELMRYELKIEHAADKRVTLGQVHGTGEKFVLAPLEGIPLEYEEATNKFFAKSH